MPPTPTPPTPRVVIYYQTHHTPSGTPISVLPLLTTPNCKPTHLILAALHLNAPPPDDNGTSISSSSSPPAPFLTLNDHPPSHPRNATLWAELSALRASGIKILALLGGAAAGTYALLDAASHSTFLAAYAPLAALVRARSLDGLDLDVEEPMSLRGIVRLIDQLRADFGRGFVITLAPVAAALLRGPSSGGGGGGGGGGNLSGFGYRELEASRGADVDWYNAQFYCGWGEAWTTDMYDAIVGGGARGGVGAGWDPRKVVMGLVTSPENGSGWVPEVVLRGVLRRLRARYGTAFGGVMGWEYFNSRPGGRERPWEWVAVMVRALRAVEPDLLTSGERSEAEALIARRMEALREAQRRQEEHHAKMQDEARRRAGVRTGAVAGAAAGAGAVKAAFYLADGNDVNENGAALPTPFDYFSDGDEYGPPEPFEYFSDGSGSEE